MAKCMSREELRDYIDTNRKATLNDCIRVSGRSESLIIQIRKELGLSRGAQKVNVNLRRARAECLRRVLAGGELSDCCDEVRTEFNLNGVERGKMRSYVEVQMEVAGLAKEDQGSGFLALARVPFLSFGEAVKG